MASQVQIPIDDPFWSLSITGKSGLQVVMSTADPVFRSQAHSRAGQSFVSAPARDQRLAIF